MEPQTKAPQATQACPQPGDTAVTNKRIGGNGFTNFSEISYGKTRGSYDQSEIAAGNQNFLLAHQLGLTVEQAARFAGVAARPALATGAPISGQTADGRRAAFKNQKTLAAGQQYALLRLTAAGSRGYYRRTVRQGGSPWHRSRATTTKTGPLRSWTSALSTACPEATRCEQLG